MSVKRSTPALVSACVTAVLLAWVGCSSGSGTTNIGAEGGTVSGPGGSKVTVPKGAVTTATTLSIEVVTSGAPAPSSGTTARGDVYAALPHGQTFAAPVRVSIPFSGTSSSRLALMTAQPGGGWTTVPGATVNGSTMEAEVSHFSFFEVVEPEGGGDPDGGSAGPINGSWLIVGFVCDGGVFDAGGMPPTLFTIDGGTGAATNEYCTVPMTFSYPGTGQVNWVVGASVCPGIDHDGGLTDCRGTSHSSTYVVSGTTLIMTEAPAPACEFYCAGMHKVTTFQKQ